MGVGQQRQPLQPPEVHQPPQVLQPPQVFQPPQVPPPPEVLQQCQGLQTLQTTTTSPLQPPNSTSNSISFFLLRNENQTCYAIAVIQGLDAIDFSGYLLQGVTPIQDNLSNTLLSLLRDRAFSNAIPIVNALNMCFNDPSLQFSIGRQHCAGEFFASLLNELQFRPLLSTFDIEATCDDCHSVQSCNLTHAVTPFLLL